MALNAAEGGLLSSSAYTILRIAAGKTNHRWFSETGPRTEALEALQGTRELLGEMV